MGVTDPTNIDETVPNAGAALTQNIRDNFAEIKQQFLNVITDLGDKEDSDATLTGIAALTLTVDEMIYAVGGDSFARTALTAFARSLLDDADAAAALATLGITPYIQTLLDDADSGAAQTTLGITAFMQTVLDDATAGDARTTLDVFAKAESVEKTLSTGSAKMPIGTTAQRDSSPADGFFRFNSTLNALESWYSSAWNALATTASVVLLTGNQSIAGVKTFTDNLINFTGANGALQIGGSDAVPFDANGLKIAAIPDDLITPAKLAQPLTAGTAVDTTSGTSIDFTNIPSWVKKITFSIAALSSSGTSVIQIRLGDSGGIEDTGYLGSVGGTLFTNGIAIGESNASNRVYNGVLVISLIGSNTWAVNGVIGRSEAGTAQAAGFSKSLSATLDRIRLTTVNGTDTFDAGSINIMYE